MPFTHCKNSENVAVMCTKNRGASSSESTLSRGMIPVAQSPDGRHEGFLEEEVPRFEAAESQAILETELSLAGLRRHSLVIQCRWFPDFTFYGDKRGKYCVSLLKSSSV